MRFIKMTIGLLFVLGINSICLAATVPQGFVDNVVASGLNAPTSMAFAPDGRLFVTEQNGRLRVIKNNSLLPTPFLQVNVNSEGERGLLGVAFDPDFNNNKYVYIYYTATTPNLHNRLSRVIANGDVMQAGSEVVLLELNSLSGATNHNGGAIHFGLDGKLYVAVGENANGAHSQDLNTLHGKMLRLNKDGSIPSDNPFIGRGRGEIWALGLRNPFTFSVHPKSGRIFINDVGQTTYEEINEGQRGANYGWPNSEGPTTQYTAPLFYYDHNNGCAITGGTFYDPAVAQFPSQFVGKYFYADFCGNYIRVLDPSSKVASGFATAIPAPVDLQVGPDGALYYLSRGDGANSARVGRISSNNGQAPSITGQPQSVTVTAGQAATFSVSATGSNLTYQWQRNGVNISGATSASYVLGNTQAADNGAGFRVQVSNSFGSVLSNTATLTVATNSLPPTGSIDAPAAGAKYSAGTTLSFSGSGSDPETGSLPASAFSWRIDFHHDTHNHPAMPETPGIKSGTFNIPNQGETSDNVFYRITLTVRDSAGLTHITTRDVLPNKASLTLATNVAGLTVNMDGQPKSAPYTVGSVVGLQRSISVSSPQTVGGKSYEFVSWSNGGAMTQTITTPNTNTTFTASFREVSTNPGTFLANEFENFTVSTATLVRYGANGKFVEKTVTGTAACTNAFFGSDPVPGVRKACYRAGTTNPVPGTFLANESENFTVSGPTLVKYGANGKFVEKTVTGTAPCTNGFFGSDPIPGVRKACYVAGTTNPVPGSFLANEDESFNVASATRVKYGANNLYVEKLVTGTAICSNAYFGTDPIVGVRKACYAVSALLK